MRRAITVLFAAACLCAQASLARETFDVPFVPTPQPVVERMLEMARVGPNDVVYDIGSGDGRVVITAARENARAAGVAERVEFRQEDLFQADFSEATVVTLYLLSSINLHLRPRLLRELKPGTRIVSHAFDMGDWKPDATDDVKGRRIYYWVVPERN